MQAANASRGSEDARTVAAADGAVSEPHAVPAKGGRSGPSSPFRPKNRVKRSVTRIPVARTPVKWDSSDQLGTGFMQMAVAARVMQVAAVAFS